MKKIPLLNSKKFAIVDDDDFLYLNRFKWSFSKKEKMVVRRLGLYNGRNRANLFIQDLVIDGIQNMFKVHKNGNILDNRKENLTLIKRAQIDQSRPKYIKNATSIYKGVSRGKNCKKWRAEISKDHKKYLIGDFKTQEEAAVAYNIRAKLLYGKNAYQNKL